jgi:hypothetical protein
MKRLGVDGAPWVIVKTKADDGGEPAGGQAIARSVGANQPWGRDDLFSFAEYPIARGLHSRSGYFGGVGYFGERHRTKITLFSRLLG